MLATVFALLLTGVCFCLLGVIALNPSEVSHVRVRRNRRIARGRGYRRSAIRSRLFR